MPFEKGKSGNPKGRPTKAEEQKLTDQLAPHSPKAIQALVDGVEKGERWAIKMYFEYMYGKPTQRTEITGTDGGPLKHEARHLADYTDDEVMDLAEQVAAYKKSLQYAI